MNRLLRAAWDRVSMYLPIILMGFFAMGTWWLVRSTPELTTPEAKRPVRHEPDYFMRNFAVKTFDGDGSLKSEVFGAEARHYPDNDTLELDNVRIRSFNRDGMPTVATATRALSTADGSEVRLLGNALVVREAARRPSGTPAPRLEFRGEFLHAFVKDEKVRSHLPVQLLRDNDRFSADSVDYDHRTQTIELRGRVRGVIQPRAGP
jgi:lipopolysaccharide export system protein LptC